MAKTEQVVEIPVGASFERRLAELLWQQCPELAKQTAAGKMALALDISKNHVLDAVTGELSLMAQNKLLPSLEQEAKKQIKELIAAATVDIVKLAEKTIEQRLQAIVDHAVVRAANNDIERLGRQAVEEYYNGKFASVVADKLDEILGRILESRLMNGRPVAEIEKAKEKFNKRRIDE